MHIFQAEGSNDDTEAEGAKNETKTSNKLAESKGHENNTKVYCPKLETGLDTSLEIKEDN